MHARRVAGAAAAALVGVLLAVGLFAPPPPAVEEEARATSVTSRAPAERVSSSPAVRQFARRAAASPLDDPAADAERELAEVSCPFPDEDLTLSATDNPYATMPLRIADGVLTLSPGFTSSGYLRERLPDGRWFDFTVAVRDGIQTCSVGALHAPTTVSGRVSNRGDIAIVRGCGAYTMVNDRTGAFLLELLGDSRCELWAERQDGLLRVLSQTVEIELGDGGSYHVELELPPARQGGLGVVFQPGEDAVRVMDVHPGTPASRAGLQPGDRILAVDGEPVAGLSAEDFIWLGVGDEGSSVTLEIEHSDGSLEEQELVRATIRG